MSDSCFINIEQFSKTEIKGKDRFQTYYNILSEDKKIHYYGFLLPINAENSKIVAQIKDLTLLNYPSIVKVYGYSKQFLDDNKTTNFLILTDVAKQETLDDLFKRLPIKNPYEEFNITQRYIVAIGIAYGMQYAHSKKHYHKSMSPSEIILDQELQPHISFLNFFDIESDSRLNFYSAPELKSSDNSTKKSDIYSFSAIFYKLLTNEDPINTSENPISYSLRINSEYLKNLFEACFNEDPNERPSFNKITKFLTKEETMTSANEIGEGKIDIEKVNNYISFLKQEFKNSEDKTLIVEGQKQNSQTNDSSRNSIEGKDRKNRDNKESSENDASGDSNTNSTECDADSNKKSPHDTSDSESVEKGKHKSGESPVKPDRTKEQPEQDKKGKGKEARSDKTTPPDTSDSESEEKGKHKSGEHPEHPEGDDNENEGESSTDSTEKKFNALKKMADGGDINAMVEYATYLYNGDGIDINLQEASKYFKLAADKGDEDAMIMYADMCRYGLGGEIKREEALFYYQKAGNKDKDHKKYNALKNRRDPFSE